MVVTAACSDSANAKERQSGQPAEQYFVDFRARPGHLLGHTIVVFGHLNERGRPGEVHYASLYPKDGQTGLIFGLVLPVDASVRAVKEDLSETASAVYRLKLAPAQYNRLRKAIRREQARETYWQMLFFNCNDFAARIAESLGLRTPPTLLLPRDFVTALRAWNQR